MSSEVATASFDVQYGAACRFDHPLEFAVELNRKGLPIRPGEPVCGFYAKKGECRYGAIDSAGPSCKFSHPDDV
jgi:serine/threonine-protein kinase/endoribonuclease IRE1